MKNEAHYEYPVNLYISKSYDDAETAQNFIKVLAGEQLTVSKSRNGDYLYVSLEGSDEDIDAFLDVYKDTFTDIVWDCDADANGWVKPKDVYDSIGQDGKVLPEESKVGEVRRSNEDYLQEVWDSLAVAWDKDKFNMGKGYDSEYECECITITSKDNEEVRAKIYVDDYNGRHPVAFKVVYRYPGDKGVGVMGTYEFQSTDMDGLGEEVFDYFDEIKQKVGESKKSEAKGPTTGDDALKQMQMDFKQYNGKTTGEIAADIRYDVATALDMPADEVDDVMQSFGLDNIYILRADGVSPKAIAQKILKANDESKKSESDETSWALEYLVETAKEKGLKVSWEGSNEICITIGTFPLQDHIFVTDDAPGKDDTSLELYVPAAHINTSGLTLQDVLDYLDDPIGKRDTVQFKNGNRSGKVEAKKSEGLPPKKLGSNRQYRSRADLINKMKALGAVEITTPAQFNDIHSKQWLHTAGYAMDINGNLIGQTYFGDKDGKWYYATTKTFQGDYLPECKEEAKKSEAEGSLGELIDKVDNMFHYHNKNLNSYQYNTIDDLLEALKSKDTDKIKAAMSNLDNLVHYRNKNLTKSQYYMLDELLEALQKKYKKSEESKKLESLTLKQKELKDMARFGQAEDITTISDAEAKELKKKGIETVGISRGVYGMNGALLRDNEGNKYVITARSSNLFYFV